ncbi:putative RNA recognition motif domain, nucleotide-binding alpha-beta plait domain superfamily [Helianthus annuus]|nr:putative RNA recognition motif domain, nucleotide-binding alpha-beta plait domain superfamily [Helianthus annuus]
MEGPITKLFISNLPEGSTPWELRKCLERFGEISGTYVAKKRDKAGCRFGFASFRNVSDKQELLNNIRGVKMGDCRLKINIARFALENIGVPAQSSEKGRHGGGVGQSEAYVQFNLRDSRSYSNVVGSSKDPRIFDKGKSVQLKENTNGSVRSIVVPDRTEALKELFGLALIGKVVNLETLVDFDRLLRIAKVVVANIQYIGGLSLLLSFHDVDSANRFLEAKGVWGPWFNKLDVWGGQSLPSERVAWLKICGTPLHLLSPAVLSQVADLYGKVVHVPKVSEEDRDLSVCRVGVLLGEAERINEAISINWKNRVYRVWVEEDRNDWIPDCLNSDGSWISEEESPAVSSPVVDVDTSGGMGNVEVVHGDSGMEVGGSLDANGSVPHANSPTMHEEREYDGAVNGAKGLNGWVSGEGTSIFSKEVGPEVGYYFVSGSGERVRKPTRSSRVGLGSFRAQTHSCNSNDVSPVDLRPRKRPRDSDPETELEQ